MPALFSILLIALIGLMLLLPPLAFVRAVARYHRRNRTGIVTRAALIAAAFLPVLINIGYLAYAWPNLRAGILDFEQNLAVAVIVAWATFWGRVALGRKGMRRRPRSG